MSNELSTLVTHLIEYVQAVIVDECRLPVDHVLRYWGEHGIPQDCGCDVLTCGADLGYASSQFPLRTAIRGDTSMGQPVWTLTLRYDSCWKAAKVTKTGLIPTWDKWDADSAVLLDCAQTVVRSLIRLSSPAKAPSAEWAAVMGNATCNGLRFIECVPSGPGGGRARITWRLYAGVVGSPLS